MASCLWLCHRMTDRLEFSNPDQALSSGGSHLVMLAPESEVLPGQVSSSLFGGLKARGGSVRDLHLHLHAAGPATVAAVVCPEAPVSSIHPFQPPNSSQRQPASRAFCQSSARNNVVWGECVLELRSFWLLRLVTGHAASLAHRRPLMLQEECGLMSLQCARGLHLGRLTQAVNDQKSF